MLAIRDQENLVHGHQTAAASKPLNQGGKHVPPKTPGARAPKTPFKIPLNDENVAGRAAGKSVMKANNNGNENFALTGKGGDKTAFVTPLGPRNRAPLGLKTTNAKAKAFQTPGTRGLDDGVEKTQQSATARRIKPFVEDDNKVEVLGDQKSGNEEREIEYMPPKPVELPDYPEDFPPDMDYSQLKGANLTRGWYQVYTNPIDDDGVSLAERQFEEQKQKADKEFDELMERVIEEMPLIGYNVPEFPGDETFVSARVKKEAEKNKAAAAQKLATSKKPALTTKGPSTMAAKNAAQALSQKPDSARNATIKLKAAPRAKIPGSFLVSSKKFVAPKPTNPSQMRHTAALVASKSTIGYYHGRSTSQSLAPKTTASKTQVNRSKRTTSTSSTGSGSATITPALFAARTQTPEIGSEEWAQKAMFSNYPSDDEVAESLKGKGWDVDEDAEQEFQFNF